jgi:hypothetical protein
VDDLACISNNDYKNTIDLLTAKLGIKEPMINRAEVYGNDHPQQSLFYKMGQIESQLTDRIDNLQNEMNHKLELKDLAWLFWLCSQQVAFLPIHSLIDLFSWFVSAWSWLPVY